MDLQQLLKQFEEREQELEYLVSHHSTDQTKDYDYGRLVEIRHAIQDVQYFITREKK